MKTLLLLTRTRDAEHVNSLFDSFEISPEDIAEQEGSEDVEGVIYNIYAQAIQSADMDEEDFQIDCNFSCSSLYHIPTQTTIYNCDTFQEVKDLQLFEELANGLSINDVYENRSQQLHDDNEEISIKKQIIGYLKQWEIDPDQLSDNEVEEMYNELIVNV